VLEVSNPRHDAATRLAEWSDLNADALGRAKGALGGIERMSHAGIAALSVALRTLRTVTKPAASGLASPVEVASATGGRAPAAKPASKKASAPAATPRKAAAAKSATKKAATKKAATTTSATKKAVTKKAAPKKSA
jgi:glutamate dehydrogenase